MSPETQTTKQKTILIIDDEPDILKMMEMRLKAKGYLVEKAGNGKKALKLLQSFVPDLIMLDLNMPKMGGIEFYHEISDANGNPKYPILVLTAREDMRDVFQGCKVEGFLVKPFEPEHLLAEVQRIMDEQKNQEQIVLERKRRGAMRLLIVDQDEVALKRISNEFSNVGYQVVAFTNGQEAMEDMDRHLPDLVVVNMILKHMTGDVVISHLNHMPHTKEICCFLYVHKDNHMSAEVSQRMSEKSGVTRLIEYSDSKELLFYVEKELHNLERKKENKRITGANTPRKRLS